MNKKSVQHDAVSDCNAKSCSKVKRPLVLLPGWATDARIFSRLNLGYTKERDVESINEHFFESLAGELIENDTRAILLGWSLGGVLAAHFTGRYPELVEKAVLVSVKERYTQDEIGKMKEYVTRDKEVYLSSFYKRSLTGSAEEDKDWFNRELKSSYLENMTVGKLVSHLSFLKDNPLPVDKLTESAEKLIFVHGKNDSIIDISEMMALKKKLGDAEFYTINNAGHVPFFSAEFGDIIEDIIW